MPVIPRRPWLVVSTPTRPNQLLPQVRSRHWLYRRAARNRDRLAMLWAERLVITHRRDHYER